MLESAPLQIAPLAIRALLGVKSMNHQLTGSAVPVELAGHRLPSQVGATVTGALHTLCLGPAEWLIVSRDDEPATIRHQLNPEPVKSGFTCVDLTDGLAALEVQGAAARELLSKGCGLDWHPRSFPPGHCARTRFAQIPVVIECLDERPSFALYVSRSYGRYLHSWLADAAAEFQQP